MTIYDLNEKQMLELKQNYLTQLADEGSYAEVVGVDYDEPSEEDLANADDIVPDDVIYDNYEDYWFEDEDFCNS